MRSLLRITALITGLMFVCAIAQTDLRDHQHGIDFLKKPDGTYYVVWASEGNPPPATSPDNWTHDIYSMPIDPASPALGTITDRISNPEAQEPASSAIMSDGTILVTNEDGYNTPNEVAQRYGVYDVNWKAIKAYSGTGSMDIHDGGHSGHCAAVGNIFVVHWCNDWTDNGGVDNLGTGNDNYVTTVTATGTKSTDYSVSTGRTWWPEIDGSPTRACLIWQKYITGQMYSEFHTRMFDPVAHTFTPDVKLHSNQLYYHYAVRYISAIDRFLIVASVDGGAGSGSGRKCSGGLAWLVDNGGAITAGPTTLPDGIIRESTIIVRDNVAVVCRLKAGNSVFGSNSNGGNTGGIFVLNLTATSITLAQTIDDTYAWQYIGIDGMFTRATNVYIIALSTKGLTEKKYTIQASTANIPIRSVAAVGRSMQVGKFFDLRGRECGQIKRTGVYVSGNFQPQQKGLVLINR